MDTPIRKLPIGMQNFEDLRKRGFLYVDKTALVYRLVSMGKPYLLNRPRRFGKSLLLSTFEAYFEGKKELFDGFAIEKLEQEWTTYPILHIDLNAEKYESAESLERILSNYLILLIEEKGYLLPYTADGRQLVKVGASFDAAERNLGEWRVVRV